MQRLCSNCGCRYGAQDLARQESKGMEKDRKALGLEGVLFRLYYCPQCAHADIFLDIHPLEGESADAYRIRKAELQAAAQCAANPDVGVALVNR